MTNRTPPIGLSGAELELRGSGYAAVVTEGGGALRALTYDGRPLLDGSDPGAMPTGGRGQLLMPWPNRIRDGHYRFGGRELQLPLTEPSRHNASHGLARWVRWEVEQHTAGTATLRCLLLAQPGYPWTLELHVRYELSPDGLRVTQSARNLATAPAPYASGAHPYLSVGHGPVDSWRLGIPAGVRLISDERKLPTGREPVEPPYDFRSPRAVADTVLDHAFTDLVRGSDERATVTLDDPDSGMGLEVWLDEHHRWVMAYTGDDLPDEAARRRSIALEPMTAPPDAFRSGEDLVVLAAAGEPDSTFAASWGIRATG
jgi:aldose 1-epimerase